MLLVISKEFKSREFELRNYIQNFNSTGILFGNGKRNKIKLFELEGKVINVKSFKIPHLINKIAYKYFRKTKARRSYEYATALLSKGIGTPQPIAYFENFNFIGLKDSYYVSEHLECDLTFRELTNDFDYPGYDDILRQFTKFTFKLHEAGIEFLDHSPGNTLIKKSTEGTYQFYLVDLNRMIFHYKMNFEQRMRNFRRLTSQRKMIEVMSNEYSVLYKEKSENEIFDSMWNATTKFQEEFKRKKNIKNKLKFWISY